MTTVAGGRLAGDPLLAAVTTAGRGRLAGDRCWLATRCAAWAGWRRLQGVPNQLNNLLDARLAKANV